MLNTLFQKIKPIALKTFQFIYDIATTPFIIIHGLVWESYTKYIRKRPTKAQFGRQMLLSYAATWGNQLLARFSLWLGADIDRGVYCTHPFYQTASPLQIAIIWGQTRMALMLMAEYAPSLYVTLYNDINKLSIFDLAAYYGRVKVIETLIHQNAGNAPFNLDYFALYGQADLLQSLYIENTSNTPFIVNPYLAVRCAIDCHHMDLLHALIQKDPQCVHAIKPEQFYNESMKYPDYTPLHYAAYKGNLEAVRILVEAGADVKSLDYKEINPSTPLHAIRKSKNAFAIARLLIKQGADIYTSYQSKWHNGDNERERSYSPLENAEKSYPELAKVMKNTVLSRVFEDGGELKILVDYLPKDTINEVAKHLTPRQDHQDAFVKGFVAYQKIKAQRNQPVEPIPGEKNTPSFGARFWRCLGY